ncbi:Gfo/Idh/MocA family protein [Anaerococcus marasmi]|uniref:Gfo/Idh/MocA family protein n=1 Tax=Anaerococcus marasmi TaxID=2057797 RepID=UPI000CF8B0C2|nr:Gfo/Idh/MocA family oxidoreductase [Anaerococcus marasmi]
MKLGIIGSGKIVKEVLPVLEQVENIDIVAIAGRNERNLEDLVEEFNIGKYYIGIDDLLADPDIHTVYVALPNKLHYEVMDKAIEFGKDIICEKPFCGNLRESEDIFERAFAKGLIVLEAASHRFIPNALAVRDELKKLGDIKIVSFNYSQYSSRYDKFKEGEIAPVFDRSMNGGALMDINFYNVDYLSMLFGRPKAVEYFPNMEKGIDTSGILYLDYGDFKAVAIGSKDSDASLVNTIQTDRGSIEITDAINSFSSFRIKESGKNVFREVNLNKPCHRMVYEFREFLEIISQRDMEKARKLSHISLDTSWILTEARKFSAIDFPND